jgi:hypothetical protein
MVSSGALVDIILYNLGLWENIKKVNRNMKTDTGLAVLAQSTDFLDPVQNVSEAIERHLITNAVST